MYIYTILKILSKFRLNIQTPYPSQNQKTYRLLPHFHLSLWNTGRTPANKLGAQFFYKNSEYSEKNFILLTFAQNLTDAYFMILVELNPILPESCISISSENITEP